MPSKACIELNNLTTELDMLDEKIFSAKIHCMKVRNSIVRTQISDLMDKRESVIERIYKNTTQWLERMKGDAA